MTKGMFWLFNAGISAGIIMTFMIYVEGIGIPATWFWLSFSAALVGLALACFLSHAHGVMELKWERAGPFIATILAVGIGIGSLSPEWCMAYAALISTILLVDCGSRGAKTLTRFWFRSVALFPCAGVFALLVWRHTDPVPALLLTAGVLFIQGCIAFGTPIMQVRVRTLA